MSLIEAIDHRYFGPSAEIVGDGAEIVGDEAKAGDGETDRKSSPVRSSWTVYDRWPASVDGPMD